MKKILFTFLLLIVSPVFAQNATSFCSAMTTRININTKIGYPRYVTNLSRRDFLARAKGKVSPYTLGLTESDLQMIGTAKPSVVSLDGKICVGLEELNIDIGFPNLTVYIDKKYMPSSCEYKTIKDHENYHVAVGQQALLFFKSDIERALTAAVQKVKPKIVTSSEDIQPTLSSLFDAVIVQLNPLIAHINEKIREKNAAIDTPESYNATKSLCKNW